MKNNIFGYLFFVFIVIIMGFAVYKVNSNNNLEEKNTTESTSIIDNTKKSTDLVLGISEFDTINPILTQNKKVQDITKIVYESLVSISEDGKAESCLAKEWETTDNLTYVVKLRTGVKWTDGTYFSSSDVKYTIDRLKDEKSKDAVYADNVKKLKEVDIIDNTTLRIILSEKVPFYEYYLTFPILSSNYYGDDDFWNTDKNEAPISTGRFYISKTAGNKILLEKNTNWWNIENDNSIIDNITLNFYSSVAELYNAFKLGGVDLISTTNSNYQEYIGKIGYNTTEIEGRNFTFLSLNTQSDILSDVNIRKAIRAVINKNEIVSSIYGDNYTTSNFPLTANYYFLEDVNKDYFNIGEFENLLTNSGWKFRNKQWQKTIDYKTKKLELNLVVRKGTQRVNVANYIKNELANQGIIIDVIEVSTSDYNKYLQNRDYDMILSEMTNPISPDLTSYFANGNLANFNNDEINEILGYINNITNEEELKSKFKKIYEIYDAQVPYIGIARNKIYIFTNSYLNGNINAKWYNLFFGFKDWYKN